MFSLICGCFQDFLFGVYDSIHGLAFIFELDKDEEFIVVNSIPQPSPRPRTVLQQRREMRGAINRPAETITRQRVRVWKRVLQCISVNVVLVIAAQLLALIFWFLVGFITPSAKEWAKATGPLIVLPVYLFTRVLMTLWFSDIAGACLRALKLPDAPPSNIRILVADIFVGIILGLVFLVQSMLVVYLPLPFIATFISFVHMSLLNSMYCFEYLWIARNCALKDRIYRLEKNWCYFTGFGTCLTLATSYWGHFMLNGCFFSALFPFFIISSYKAKWKRESIGKHMPAVQIFTPSMLLTNRVVSVISNYFTSP